MIGAPGPRKLDLTRSSIVRAGNKALWDHLTDLARWPGWLRTGDGGSGLAEVTALGPGGAVQPDAPELGRRYRLAFTNGFAGEFQVTYWTYPSQISLGLVRETRQGARGVEGLIFDLDFFPQRDGTTQLWFGALVMLEKGFRPGVLARWPRREIRGWVDGFHARVAREAPSFARRRDEGPPRPGAGAALPAAR